jgi:hypothetical protein
LRVDPAEELRTVDDDFVALHVEAHMLDQASVVRQVAGPRRTVALTALTQQELLEVIHLRR